MVSEDFFNVFPITSLWELLIHKVWSGFNVGEHNTLLHTQYIWFQRNEDFYVFPITSLWEQLIPGVWPVFPQGLDWQDLCKGTLDIATYQI